MPLDRATPNNARPLKPTLASARTAKTPITPRLAPSAVSASSSRPARSNRSDVGSTPRGTAPSNDDLSTPAKSFLSSNITPRSSSRKSRPGVTSAASTPTGTPSATPTSTRPGSTIDYPSSAQGHGYNHTANKPRSVVAANTHNVTPTPRPPIANVYNHPRSDVGGTKGAMFFHASDARPPEPAPAPKKGPVFFYANGQQDESPRASEAPSPLSSVGRAPSESKFFHADSLSEARGSPPILTPPPTTTSPEPWSNSNATAAAGQHSLRPPSPSKENIHLSYRKGASQVIRPNLHSRPSALSIISGTHTPSEYSQDSIRSRRRSSAASSALRLGHGKSASLSSIDSVTSLKKVSSNDLGPIAPSPLHTNRVVSDSSLPESVASAPEAPKEPFSGLPSPNLTSPTKTDGQSALQRMNELAANARRERKVLDLEISNSSLLAINRSLEKEVRKQKAEIRRYRRMSRAGRFSADATAAALENFSALGASEIGGLSDMSEQEETEDEDQEDHDEYSSESSIDEGALSPTTLAQRDAAHRLRDEKRLQLDLSKHRELLLDSQKMNQSLKRCLNWTEELIKDAQKALTYQVRVSDVKLGGRVLSSDEYPGTEEGPDGRGLLSPWTPPQRANNPMDDASLAGSEKTDRDSGVDLDGLKPVPSLQSDFSPLGSPLGETPSRQPIPRSTGSIGETF